MTALMFRLLALVMFAALAITPAAAQTLTASNVRIEWEVVNRFRLFRDADDFKMHERAWRQYLIHAENLGLPDEEEARLVQSSSVLGTEHVLNDRFIPFTQHLRSRFDWRGWAASIHERLCWDEKSQSHAACGGSAAYVMPQSHEVKLHLTALGKSTLFQEFNCEWRVDGGAPVTAPCDEAVTAAIPYPAGAQVSVNAEGESAISRHIAVKDLLIAGLGDSFASGEGNPDVPVVMTGERRHRNFFPARKVNDASGGAVWIDERCHRSLYGHQLRAALQIAIENPRSAVTFLGYACSGASVEEGILGPQTYVDYVSRSTGGDVAYNAVKGSKRDAQLYRLLADLCLEKPEEQDGLWRCRDNAARRPIDLVLLGVGGNDIGFSGLVAWSSLRRGVSSRIARYLGTTVSADQFAKNMRDNLPRAYAKLAKAIETALPLRSGDIGFDASRVVLSSYPDILADEDGDVCAAGEEDDDELRFPANQSLDYFSSWFVVTADRMQKAHDQLRKLHGRMGELAEDHGWTFAGRAYADAPFRGHGFCAQNLKRLDDPAEALQMPCWRKPANGIQSCSGSWSGGERVWQPFDPASQIFPYALRQRWVRTFNDAYLVLNSKVTTRAGAIDERSTAAAFAETTGAMHPTAEGHAAMADAILLDIRDRLRGELE